MGFRGRERSSPAPGPDAFRAVVEAAPFGMHLYRLEPDERLVFTGANAAADRILGVENAAFVGRTIEEAFPPLAATAIPARYRDVARTGVAWHDEQVTYEDHRIVGAYEVHAFPIGPSEMAVAFHDITARKRGEQALLSERERLAVTLRSIGDAVITTDAGGRVVLVNPPAEQLTGWSAAEAAGRRLSEVFRIASEETGLPVPDPAERVLREGMVIGLANHTVLLSRDGARRPIADSAAPIRTPAGELLGVVLVFRDQSAERQAEAQLTESEARYRAILRSVPVVQWATDRNGVFTLSEGLGLSALGLKPGQVVGWTVAEVYKDNPGVLADFQRALHGEAFLSENRLGPHVFESHWGPIRNDAGAIVGVTGIARDVTKERALQEQVARAQKLESLGRLAGGVAHDFNNLLTVVLSAAEVLREDAAAKRPAGAEEVAEIAAAGERARDLVRQLLATARKQVIAPAPTDLGEVVRASEKLLRRALGEDVALELRIAAGLWPVLCDPGQFEQVLLNLTLNARDAMARGGRLTIGLENATVVADDREGHRGGPSDWVRMVVRDTGVGMSDEVMAHVFEPFFTTKEPGAGTGLGLASVYGVVAQNGGHIHVASAPGQGTTFEICLPRCADPARPARGAAAAGAKGGHETVLVVEDDPLVRSVTRRALRHAGYEVLVANDGAEALAIAEAEDGRIGLVVTDVVMPGMTGPALARKFAERWPALKVLFVSGYSREAMAERGLEEAGAHFLSKPFTASAFLERVRWVLDE